MESKRLEYIDNLIDSLKVIKYQDKKIESNTTFLKLKEGYYTLNNKDSKLNYVLRVTSAKEIVSNLLGITDKLGIIGSTINDEKANVTGVYIENVRPNRDAAKAGILPTDIILSINDNKINTQEDIYNAIKDKKSGDTIICDLLRDGNKTTMNVQFS